MADKDEELSPEENDLVNHFIDALSWYMVALSGAFQPKHYDGISRGSPEFFCFPGIIFAIGKRRLFVTAGHNLRALKNEYGEKYHEWVGIAWAHFLEETKCGRTLSADNSAKRIYFFECDFAEHKSCVEAPGTTDWGVLELTDKEWAWLENEGVHAFSVDDIKTVNDDEGCVLTGLPVQFFDKLKIHHNGASTAVNPTAISLRPRSDLSVASKNWIVGDLPELATFDIRGMSGGPLFAFGDNPFEIWVAGIQSHWCPDLRIAFVCPMKTILDQLPSEYAAEMSEKKNNG